MTLPPSIRRPGLRVTGVCHRFGPIVAADDVGLEVRPGEVHCLLGPSGSGKSTLLRLIAGLERLQAGSISIGDVPVATGNGVHVPPEKRSAGFVFQDYALFPHLDARGNVAFGMTRGTKREKRHAADEWLERVGLTSHAGAMPHTLSGGQQQRVALARALATEPEVMLLDEPFSGLDQQLRSEVRGKTLELLREAGVATLMITHDPWEALSTGNQVSVIRVGRILQTGTPEDVYRRSASRQVAEIFGPVNRFSATARSGRAPSPWGELEATADGTPLDGPVEILVRTDSLILHRRGTAAASQRTVPGTIVAVSTAGSLATLRVELDERLVEAQELARGRWRVGESVEVGLEKGGAWALPVAPG